MKLSVLIPTVDEPQGSGTPHRHLKQAIYSALGGGWDEIEVLVGSDGVTSHQGAMQICNEIGDRRVCALWYEKTDSWGHFSTKEMLREATGDIVSVLDTDDSYLPCALHEAMTQCADFPERPLFGRILHQSGFVVWTKEGNPWPKVINDARGIDASDVQKEGCFIPRDLAQEAEYPFLPRKEGAADIRWIGNVWEKAAAAGRPVVWSKSIFVVCRPWLGTIDASIEPAYR